MREESFLVIKLIAWLLSKGPTAMKFISPENDRPKNTIRTLLEEAIKCVHWDRLCYTPGIKLFVTSVNAFILHTFLLRYVHFSPDAVFIELHLLD